jgi:hypothetical protein
MTSRGVRTPGLVIRDKPFDPRHPVSELVEVVAHCLEGRIWPRLISAWPGRDRAVSDEDAPALVGLHELLLAEHTKRMVDGHRRYAIATGQFPARWQPLSGFESPSCDARPQIIGHLHVGRSWIVRIWLHASSVRRSGCLGRTGHAPRRYCPRLCSDVSYLYRSSTL